MVVLRISAAFALLFFATALGRELLEVQQASREEGLKKEEEKYYWHRFVVTQRRLLVGPGSSPPTCRARCGTCFPCRPVRVAIQPSLITPLEYYPEAWRCKCGNKLFMP